VLARVLPGFNLLLGSEANPRLIINALDTVTSTKVLSAPSLVVTDNQPAILEVGQDVPISTGSATVLTTQNTVVNTIDMRSTGIILKVLPHVHPRLHADVNPHNGGYLIGTGIFIVVFVAAVIAQILVKKFNPWIYWLAIVASTTVQPPIRKINSKGTAVLNARRADNRGKFKRRFKTTPVLN
jgi:type II secretory pathway component HofQ